MTNKRICLESITKPTTHELYDFTQDIRQAFTEDELTKAAFNVSETVTLELGAEHGREAQECGRKDRGKEWLNIAFEDDDNYFLQFTTVASSGYKHYLCYNGQQGQVSYGGLTYNFTTASGGSPYLKIDIDSSNTVNRDVQKAKGRPSGTEQTSPLILQSGIAQHPVSPDVDVPFYRQIPLVPLGISIGPGFLIRRDDDLMLVLETKDFDERAEVEGVIDDL